MSKGNQGYFCVFCFCALSTALLAVPAGASTGATDYDSEYADCLGIESRITDKNLIEDLVAYAYQMDVPHSSSDRKDTYDYRPVTTVTTASLNHGTQDNNGTCIDCHSDAGHLIKNVKPEAAPPEDGCATATDRPAFLNAFVKSEFVDTVHGKIGCTNCHGGDSHATTAEDAHRNITSGAATCVTCHQEITQRHESSLHKTLNGMRHALELRSGTDNFHVLEPAWQADCASCHAECSDCHITQPMAIGGGMLKGHEFIKRPPMEETCAVCHGSRAGGEYLGHFEGVTADVHFQAGMHCLDCHKNDLHGDGNIYQTRWEVNDSPSCTDCHEGIPNQTAVAHNGIHEDLSCQVCHSQPYQNCFSCHATIEDGQYYRSVDHKDLDIKIGSNTAEHYQYDIVPLRSNPAGRNTFNYFGDNVLPHYDAHPTWKTAAPHNIQRVTEQNRRCDSCHGNEELFLRDTDLDPNGSRRNIKSVLPDHP